MLPVCGLAFYIIHKIVIFRFVPGRDSGIPCCRREFLSAGRNRVSAAARLGASLFRLKISFRCQKRINLSYFESTFVAYFVLYDPF